MLDKKQRNELIKLYNKYFLAQATEIGQPIKLIPNNIKDLDIEDQSIVIDLLGRVEENDKDDLSIKSVIESFQSLINK